jgi:hypothetical protein
MRIIYTLLLLALSTAAIAQIPTNGLQARFPFNNTLNDTTANAHSLSPVVNPTALTYVAGHDTINQALDLANANGCAYLISDTNFTFNDSTLTVSFWAFIDSNELTGLSPQALFATTNGTTNVASHSVEYQRSSTTARLLCYAYYTPTYTNYAQFSFDVLPYLNEWHQYTYRYNKATPATGMQLFIDGRLVAGQPVDSTLTVNAGSNQIKLGVAGGYCVTTTQYDELLVYSSSLTNAEVASIFNTQNTGCPKIAGTFVQDGQSLQICADAGEFYSLQAGYSFPTSVNYQWLKDGAAIPGATQDNYSYELVTTSNGLYSMQLTTDCDTLILGPYTLTVNPIPSKPTIAHGSSSVTPSCNNAADDYTWYFNGTLFPEGDGQQSITATANGEYSVVITVNGCESVESDPVTVTAVVGIGEVNSNISLSLYPNPTSQTIAISTS